MNLMRLKEMIKPQEMINKINHKCKIVDGKILPSDIGRFKNDLERFNGKDCSITIDNWKKLRSDKQNNSLWLYFTLLATELNLAGYDMRKLIEHGVEISWTKDTIADYLWKPIQKEMFKTNSTTKLTTEQINQIYDEVNRITSEKGVSVAFPNVEQLFGE